MEKAELNSPDEQLMSEHACFFYRTRAEQLTVLVDYFSQGLAANELCVLATPELPETMITRLETKGLDVRRAVALGSFKILDMDQTYLDNNRFIAKYMIHNLGEFLKDARRLGYSGLRTAGEMSWLLSHGDSISEAINYQASVNNLQKTNNKLTGLCLYPFKDSFKEIIQPVLKIHPQHYLSANLERSY